MALMASMASIFSRSQPRKRPFADDDGGFALQRVNQLFDVAAGFPVGKV
jgi:hypothetical protein